MALWRIVVKNSGNAACKDKRQRLEKGMFIETSTVSPIPPTNAGTVVFEQVRYRSKCSKHEQWIFQL